ncbi:hypothetical protein HDA32_005528 [Spinactinospora alkalitolerans]|uniref:Camelysin metallo-endopeptidase n=1 Tax=Spinactinospora alkalitolerans TaxID=687207 RepID=A0A852U2F7_9ACTN|nr:hypothetical protein [Spinactinospora alkalitolerans]NYE50408.1 hypothetical protein [Spinactinospora alkalitolerans]
MTLKKRTALKKRAALALGAAATVGALMLCVGGTYAYFTANARGQAGEIRAGDLSVDAAGLGPEDGSGPVAITAAAPGRRWPASDGDSYTLVVNNTGSVDARIEKLLISITGGGADGRPNLSEALEIRYTTEAKRSGAPDWDGGSGWAALPRTSASVLDSLRRRPGTVGAGETQELHFQVRWPDGDPDHDNRFQGAGTEFAFTVRLGQA